MSTHDVPGANPDNDDELAMGCWAEHDDGSLIFVEMLAIPIKLFIGWLIIEAARADGEGKDSDLDLLEDIHQFRKPRCISCGRFIAPKKAARRIAFCRPICLERELAAA